MDELFTRCPTCRTVFRTREDQLAVQAGKVRCGHCRMVFDGRTNLVDLHPQAAEDDQAALGPPTVTLRTAIDLHPVRADDDPHIGPAVATSDGAESDEVIEVTAPPSRPGEDEFASPTVIPARPGTADWPVAGIVDDAHALDGLHAVNDVPAADGMAAALSIDGTPGTAAGAGIQETAGPQAFARTGAEPSILPASTADVPSPAGIVTPYHWQPVDRERQRRDRWKFGMLALLLAAGLAVQAAHHFRNAIAAQYPSLRPDIVAACMLFGCTIEPTHYRDDITIESHDLQADPAHQGLLILQTTLRNRAAHPVAFPHLELELDDLGGQPLLRRVFPPVDYAGGAADFTTGIPANGEWNVKLFLDASAISAGGYKLYVFYL